MALAELPPGPYELLFRWDEVTGQLKGAHFRQITTITKDGVAISSVVGDAMPVSVVQGQTGFDLSTVLGTVTLTQQATIDAQAKDAEAMKAYVTTLEAQLAAKDANIQTLLAQVAALTPTEPVTVPVEVPPVAAVPDVTPVEPVALPDPAVTPVI